MSNFLLLATPLYGHVAPVVTIGQALAARGHRVAVLTGAAYRGLVVEHGCTFLPLPADSDLDAVRLDRELSRRRRWPRWSAGRDDVIAMFVDTLPGQAMALDRALATGLSGQAFDAVISDTAFMGVQPLLLGPMARPRPPVIGISATPLSVISQDGAPFNSGLRPGNDPRTQRRNRRINWMLAHVLMRPLHVAVDRVLAPYGVAAGTLDYFDHVTSFDTTFHLGIGALEYPRPELPASVRFAGPLRQSLRAEQQLPPWWPDLTQGRPVVHVTQGTMDNADLGRLVGPTVRGLAEEDVLVVVATGGRTVSALDEALGGARPANVRAAEFLSYEALLPLVDVMVTNGGYGGVQQAVRHGVPLVVAGATEDKPEVAARVAWAGVGLNLRTGRPGPAAVRRAVRQVLGQPGFRQRARELGLGADQDEDPLTRIVGAAELRAGSTVRPTDGGSVPGSTGRPRRILSDVTDLLL